jgi:hypothetical protein
MWPELSRGGIVPFAAAAVAWFLLARPWRRAGGPAAFVSLAGALAVGIGILAGYVALFGVPSWPIREHWRRMVIVIAASALVAAAASWRRLPRGLDAAVGVLLSAGLAGLIVPAFAELEETRTAWRVGVGATLAATWILSRLTRGGESDRPFIPLLCLVLAAVASAIVLVQAGNARLAQVAGAMAAAAGALTAAALWRPAYVSRRAAQPSAALPLVGLIFLGRFYDSAGLPIASFALAAAAPLSIGIADMLPLGSNRWRAAVRIVAVVILAGAAIALTLGQAADEPSYY